MVDYRDAFRMQVEGLIASNAWNKLYKRSIWNHLRYREGHNYEDLDIILPLIERAKKVCLLNDTLIIHRKRKGSITTTLSYTNIMDRFIAYCHYEEYIRRHIPEFFEERHLKLTRERFYAMLLSEYYRYTFYRIPDKKKNISLIRSEITYVYNYLDITECSIKVRLLSWLFANVPHVVSGAAYSIFRQFRIILTITDSYSI